MNNFFSLSQNSNIGFKKLSDADLGLGVGSNQTHIGLFGNTLSFDRAHKAVFSKLIYQNSSLERICLLDFIENPDGSYRSPKTRTGSPSELQQYGDSIVKEIRQIVNKQKQVSAWFLIWFELSNGEFVFYLIAKNSNEYNDLKNLIPNIDGRGSINAKSISASPLLRYLEIKTELSNLDYLKDLEVIAQVGEIGEITGVSGKIAKPRRFDIEKATKRYSETGRKGEELIAEYLSKLKSSNSIKDFDWVNKSKESSFPYDFEITHDTSKKVFMDVKTTSYTFDQKMIFSNSEIAFMSRNKNYYIYRVYDLSNDEPSLRVCENTNDLSSSLNKNVDEFKKVLNINEVGISSIKFQVSPTNSHLRFENKINLLA